MKNRTKLTLAVLALTALLLTVLAGCGGNGESTASTAESTGAETAEATQPTTEEQPGTTEEEPPAPADRDTLVKALIETALAYYYKNPYTQYDSQGITIEGDFKAGRNSWRISPQFAEADQYHYTVCTSYASAIYKFAFDYEITAANGNFLATAKYKQLQDEKAMVYFRQSPKEADLEQIGKDIKALLEPGDIVVCYGSGAGHAMIFLGDCLGDGTNYVIHCWGSHITDGVDKVEKSGAIKLQPEDELLFGEKVGSNPNYRVNELRRVNDFVCVYRPFVAEDFTAQITPEARSRMAYPRICVNKYLNITQYNSVKTGDQITLTVEIQNHSKEAYQELSVKEPAPEGARLVKGTPEQKVNVPAGETLKLEFVYEITGKQGETVVIPVGAVDENIPTRDISLQIGGDKLTDAQVAGLNKLAERAAAGQEEFGQELAMIGGIYKALTDKELGLPATVEELLNVNYSPKRPKGTENRGLILSPAGEANQAVRAMTVRKMVGGMYFLVDEGVITDRCQEFQESFFEPGDIIVTLSGYSRYQLINAEDARAYLYLGNNRMLSLHEGKAEVASGFSTMLLGLLGQNQYLVLRPSLSLSGLSAVDNSAKFN